MFVWFLALSVVVVWQVFQSPALDYRGVLVGSVLPLVDAAFGGPRLAHTLLGPVMVLAVVMLATRQRRLLRRALLGLPIGMFVHLLLDGVWTRRQAFWWPLFGFDSGPAGLPELSRGPAGVALEVVGVAVAVWAWRQFGLSDPARRGTFLATGRLVGPEGRVPPSGGRGRR